MSTFEDKENYIEDQQSAMAMQQIMGGMQQGGNPLQAPEMTPS
jgi:hypothetical protein